MLLPEENVNILGEERGDGVGGPFFLDLARGLTLSDGFESVQASRIALLAGHLRETKKVTALP